MPSTRDIVAIAPTSIRRRLNRFFAALTTEQQTEILLLAVAHLTECTDAARTQAFTDLFGRNSIASALGMRSVFLDLEARLTNAPPTAQKDPA